MAKRSADAPFILGVRCSAKASVVMSASSSIRSVTPENVLGSIWFVLIHGEPSPRKRSHLTRTNVRVREIVGAGGCPTATDAGHVRGGHGQQPLTVATQTLSGGSKPVLPRHSPVVAVRCALAVESLVGSQAHLRNVTMKELVTSTHTRDDRTGRAVARVTTTTGCVPTPGIVASQTSPHEIRIRSRRGMPHPRTRRASVRGVLLRSRIGAARTSRAVKGCLLRCTRPIVESAEAPTAR